MNTGLRMGSRWNLMVAAFWEILWRLSLIAPTWVMVVKLRSFTLQRATFHLVRAVTLSGRT